MTKRELQESIKTLRRSIADLQVLLNKQEAELNGSSQGEMTTISVKDASVKYSTPEKTIYTWIRLGRVPYTKSPINGMYLLNKDYLDRHFGIEH